MDRWPGKNRHANKRTNTGVTDKTIVMSLVHFETREVRSRVIADVTAISLLPAIQEEVNMERTALHTDGHKAYGTVAKGMAAHVTVDHSVGQYVSAMGIGTNPAEGFFSQLKRSVDRTHHHVSREHCPATSASSTSCTRAAAGPTASGCATCSTMLRDGDSVTSH